MASKSWNKVELMGNLTRDPELRYTPQGTAVCSFGLATNRTYVYEGEKREEVDFHRIVAWNKLAELCNQLLKKGSRVFVSGRLQNREWEGQDGQKRQTTEIVIEDMILLTSGRPFGEEAASPEEIPSGNTNPLPKSIALDDSQKNSDKEEENQSKVEDQPKEVTTPEVKAANEEVADDDLPF